MLILFFSSVSHKWATFFCTRFNFYDGKEIAKLKDRHRQLSIRFELTVPTTDRWKPQNLFLYLLKQVLKYFCDYLNINIVLIFLRYTKLHFLRIVSIYSTQESKLNFYELLEISFQCRDIFLSKNLHAVFLFMFFLFYVLHVPALCFLNCIS